MAHLFRRARGSRAQAWRRRLRGACRSSSRGRSAWRLLRSGSRRLATARTGCARGQLFRLLRRRLLPPVLSLLRVRRLLRRRLLRLLSPSVLVVAVQRRLEQLPSLERRSHRLPSAGVLHRRPGSTPSTSATRCGAPATWRFGGGARPGHGYGIVGPYLIVNLAANDRAVVYVRLALLGIVRDSLRAALNERLELARPLLEGCQIAWARVRPWLRPALLAPTLRSCPSRPASSVPSLFYFLCGGQRVPLIAPRCAPQAPPAPSQKRADA